MAEKEKKRLQTADYSKLQNGSDVRGVALSGVIGEPVTMTPDAAGRIARAFVRWLSRRIGRSAGELTIGVGRDSRLSGPDLAAAVMDGILEEGADCGDCGLASTPAMFMSTVLPGFGWDGAVMITASHLPWNRNGMKFFTPQGGLEKEDIKGLLAMAGEADFSKHELRGECRQAGLMDAYAAHLRRVIIDGIGQGERPLQGMKIAVDAGNGAGGILPPAGAGAPGSGYLRQSLSGPGRAFPQPHPKPGGQDRHGVHLSGGDRRELRPGDHLRYRRGPGGGGGPERAGPFPEPAHRPHGGHRGP